MPRLYEKQISSYTDIGPFEQEAGIAESKVVFEGLGGVSSG